MTVDHESDWTVEEMRRFDDAICRQLSGVFGHSRERSEELLRDYRNKFPYEDYDCFSHDGPFGMALRVEYDINLQRDIEKYREEFLDWRVNFNPWIQNFDGFEDQFLYYMNILFRYDRDKSRSMLKDYLYNIKKYGYGYGHSYLDPREMALRVKYLISLNRIPATETEESSEYLNWKKQFHLTDRDG